MSQLNSFGRRFDAVLIWVKNNSKRWQESNNFGPKIHISSSGKTITLAYEQIRKAAEYVEENLLLQRAISRFYRRYFLAQDEKTINDSANDLILELTFASYLQNDTIPKHLVETINHLVAEYYKAYLNMPPEFRDRSNAWLVDVLAVKIERLLSDHSRQDGFVQFVYDYFYEIFDTKALFKESADDDYPISLFASINHVLLKTDSSIVRTGLVDRYAVSPEDLINFTVFNQRIDRLLADNPTERLERAVNREGAPFRILWRMIDSHNNMSELIRSSNRFLSEFEAQINQEYGRISEKIKRGIVRSIAFLIVTKFVIGILIEIPYDRMMHGEILWLPLAINLFFPPVYMMILSMMLPMPGEANTRALTDKIDEIIYGSNNKRIIVGRNGKQFNIIFKIVYALLFLIVFGSATWILVQLQFSVLHLAIFFIFLSTASFLGFRLTRVVSEIEVVGSDQSALTVIRDVFYMPFVVVGHWISDKYGKMNIMTMILDMAIELPLKSFLKLVRQWSAFISSQKDEL